MTPRRFSAEKLREVRESQGMTQRELCRLSGVSFTYICQLESRQQNVPTVDKAFAIADALKVSIYAITTRRAAPRKDHG